MTTKHKISIGSKDILDIDEFLPKNVKVRITTFIDKDVLDELKTYARKKGIKYQTALNAVLRSFFEMSPKAKASVPLTEKRIRNIVQDELKNELKSLITSL